MTAMADSLFWLAGKAIVAKPPWLEAPFAPHSFFCGAMGRGIALAASFPGSSFFWFSRQLAFDA